MLTAIRHGYLVFWLFMCLFGTVELLAAHLPFFFLYLALEQWDRRSA